MKIITFKAITNGGYEDHRLITAMFHTQKVLFNNNMGNFTVYVDDNTQIEHSDFIKKFNVRLDEEYALVYPKTNETIRFTVKFTAVNKAPQRNPESYKKAIENGNIDKIKKNGFCLSDKTETVKWLSYVLSNSGATDITISLCNLECWNDGHNGRVIIHNACGICKIFDETKFANLLNSGIGNEKHLGLGILLL